MTELFSLSVIPLNYPWYEYCLTHISDGCAKNRKQLCEGILSLETESRFLRIVDSRQETVGGGAAQNREVLQNNNERTLLLSLVSVNAKFLRDVRRLVIIRCGCTTKRMGWPL